MPNGTYSTSEVLALVSRAADALAIAASGTAAEYVIEGPTGPVTRDLRVVVAALEVAEGELAHQCHRLEGYVQGPQGQGVAVENYVGLWADYRGARRALKVLRGYLAVRLARGAAAAGRGDDDA